MKTGVYWQILYWLSTPVLAVLSVVLFWRKLSREFPLFFVYILVACLSDVARLIAYQGSFRTYSDTYWITQLVNSAFALAAIYELFLRRMFPRFFKVRFYRYLFSLTAIIVIALATVTAFYGLNIVVRFSFRILHVIDLLRVIALFFLVALMTLMGRDWGRYAFGIALGFAVDATAFLSALSIWTRPGLLREIANLMPVIAYDLACLIWLIYFLRPGNQVLAVTGPTGNSELVRQARAMEGALKDSLSGKRPRSEE